MSKNSRKKAKQRRRQQNQQYHRTIDDLVSSIENKDCTHCHKNKPITDFYTNGGENGSVQSWCKECSLTHQQQKRDERRESEMTNETNIKSMRPDIKGRNEMPGITKWCLHCNTTKPVDEFYNNKANYDGLHTYCKVCSKEYNNEYIANNKDKIQAQRKKRNDEKARQRDIISSMPRPPSQQVLANAVRVSEMSIDDIIYAYKLDTPTATEVQERALKVINLADSALLQKRKDIVLDILGF